MIEAQTAPYVVVIDGQPSRQFTSVEQAAMYLLRAAGERRARLLGPDGQVLILRDMRR
jgi:hypothetical protein